MKRKMSFAKLFLGLPVLILCLSCTITNEAPTQEVNTTPTLITLPTQTLVPTVLPTYTPTTDPRARFSDPNYVYQQVKNTISTKDSSYLQEFYTGDFFEIGSFKYVSCGAFGYVTPPLDIIENHLNGDLKCEGILYNPGGLAVYYSGWEPGLQDCGTGSPDHDGAFVFWVNDEGNYELHGIRTGTMQAYYSDPPGTSPYNVIPCDVEDLTKVQPPVCPGAVPQRLAYADAGIVCPNDISINLYVVPPPNARGSGVPPSSVPSGTEFEVSGGPYCVGDGLTWYNILFTNDRGSPSAGYVSEANSEGDYQLCPKGEVPLEGPPLPTANPKVDLTDMVFIAAGEFQMGCDPNHNDGIECRPDSLPLHSVFLDSYYIDKTEVTNAQYARCVAAGICELPGTETWGGAPYYYDSDHANHPVHMVLWDQANDYCTWIGKRLPTEAEWEKAAHGTDPQAYPWGDSGPSCELVNMEHFNSSCPGEHYAGFAFPQMAGSYPTGASPYGVLDMSGNMIEWVNDWYSEEYYANSPYDNPTGPTSGTSKVLRGGSFFDFMTLSERSANHPEKLTFSFGVGVDFGFRCATSAP